MPVAAVILAGKPKVNCGSSIAISGKITGDTTPIFVVFPVVTIATGVASEPVPAVVGINISGSLLPLILPTPYPCSNDSCCNANNATNLAESRDDPPPMPIITSELYSMACLLASSMISDGGSATILENTPI